MAVEHPEIVEQMKNAYDQWWSEVRPLMVNETAPLLEKRPYWIDFEKQKQSIGIQFLSATEKVK